MIYLDEMRILLWAAEWMGKTALGILIGFALVFLIRGWHPALKHQLWLTVFAFGSVMPALLFLPRWEWVPSLSETPELGQDFQKNVIPEIVERSQPLLSAQPAAFPQSTESTFDFRLDWLLLAVWLIGFVIMLGRSITAQLFLRKLEQAASPPESDVASRFLKLCPDFRNPPRLIVTNQITSPITWGLFRSRIALPVESEKWPTEKWEMVIRHELEHVRRRDAVALLISRCFLALNWMNPFAWIAIRQITQFREEACDHQVISSGQHSATDYAELLFQQAKFAAKSYSPYCTVAAVAQTGTIEKRIQSILHSKSYSTKTKTMKQLIPILLIITIGLVTFAGEKKETPAAAEKEENTFSGIEANTRKLQSIFIPKLEFHEVPFPQAIRYLKQISVERDIHTKEEDKKGVNFIISSSDENLEKHLITLHLINVPLSVALRYTAELAQHEYETGNHGIIIKPKSEHHKEEMITNVWRVSENFLSEEAAQDPGAAKAFLEALGIQFPEGAAVFFDIGEKRITMTNFERHNSRLEQQIDRFHAQQIEEEKQKEESEQEADTPTPKVGKVQSPEQKKLSSRLSLVIPDLHFIDIHFSEAIAFLESKSKELDPDHIGVKISLSSDLSKAKLKTISFRSQNIPVGEAIHYSCEAAGVQWVVQDHGILIKK